MKMTPKQIEKFKRSDEFFNASKLTYPYGFDGETRIDQVKRDTVGEATDKARAEWKGLYSEATGEGWEQNLDRFHAACTAETNADDSVREGCFAEGSLAYYNSCFLAFEGYEGE
jgi:hypothetical protein